jgi:hypothetical protein
MPKNNEPAERMEPKVSRSNTPETSSRRPEKNSMLLAYSTKYSFSKSIAIYFALSAFAPISTGFRSVMSLHFSTFKRDG